MVVELVPACSVRNSQSWSALLQEKRRLEYYCKNCDYVEDSNPQDW